MQLVSSKFPIVVKIGHAHAGSGKVSCFSSLNYLFTTYPFSFCQHLNYAACFLKPGPHCRRKRRDNGDSFTFLRQCGQALTQQVNVVRSRDRMDVTENNRQCIHACVSWKWHSFIWRRCKRHSCCLALASCCRFIASEPIKRPEKATPVIRWVIETTRKTEFNETRLSNTQALDLSTSPPSGAPDAQRVGPSRQRRRLSY